MVRGPKFLLCQKTVSWVGLQMYKSYAFGAVAIKTVLGFIHLPVMPPCFSLCPSLVLFYWMESQHQTEWHFTLPFESIDEHSRDCQPLAELRCVGQEKQWPRMSVCRWEWQRPLFSCFVCVCLFVFLMINKENNPKCQSVEEVVKLRLCSSDIQLARSERQPFPYVPDRSWDPWGGHFLCSFWCYSPGSTEEGTEVHWTEGA